MTLACVNETNATFFTRHLREIFTFSKICLAQKEKKNLSLLLVPDYGDDLHLALVNRTRCNFSRKSCPIKFSSVPEMMSSLMSQIQD